MCGWTVYTSFLLHTIYLSKAVQRRQLHFVKSGGTLLVHHHINTKLIAIKMTDLQGRVKFPTGGDERRLAYARAFLVRDPGGFVHTVDLVQLQGRQYSLDGRRGVRREELDF